jgi:hypothetical protein
VNAGTVSGAWSISIGELQLRPPSVDCENAIFEVVPLKRSSCQTA